MNFRSISARAAHGDEYGRRAKAHIERACLGGCGAVVYAPKVRCKPCQADHMDRTNRESKKRCAARRAAEA